MTAGTNADLREAFVLHLRPWRETSLIVELLTEELGRIAVIARGQRRARRGSAPVQPFTLLQVAWRGRGELPTATSMEIERSHRLLGDALYAGLYVNELIMRLLQREDPHPEVFAAYADTLRWLQAGLPLEPVLRRFELRLLDALGYGFALDSDCTGRPLTPEDLYRVEPEAGLVPLGVREADGRGEGLEFSGALLGRVAAGDLDELEVSRAAKRITRLLLAPHLGPKPLRSRALFAHRRGGADGSAPRSSMPAAAKSGSGQRFQGRTQYRIRSKAQRAAHAMQMVGHPARILIHQGLLQAQQILFQGFPQQQLHVRQLPRLGMVPGRLRLMGLRGQQRGEAGGQLRFPRGSDQDAIEHAFRADGDLQRMVHQQRQGAGRAGLA